MGDPDFCMISFNRGTLLRDVAVSKKTIKKLFSFTRNLTIGLCYEFDLKKTAAAPLPCPFFGYNNFLFWPVLFR
jgi:hypothetical protein